MFTIKQGEFGYHSKKPPVLFIPQFEVRPGSVVGLLGGNGAGKTTFIKGISGLLKHTWFESMEFNGAPASPGNPEFKRNRMTVFTEDQSFRNWSFETYLDFVSSAYDKAPDNVLHELIDGFNFGSFTKVRIGELSSGNSKKARLIAAFAIRPPLLILDEPVDALDFLGTDFLYNSIRKARDSGTSIIMSSHVAESLIDTADILYILQRGTLTGPKDVPNTRDKLVSLLDENRTSQGE